MTESDFSFLNVSLNFPFFLIRLSCFNSRAAIDQLMAELAEAFCRPGKIIKCIDKILNALLCTTVWFHLSFFDSLCFSLSGFKHNPSHSMKNIVRKHVTM